MQGLPLINCIVALILLTVLSDLTLGVATLVVAVVNFDILMQE